MKINLTQDDEQKQQTQYLESIPEQIFLFSLLFFLLAPFFIHYYKDNQWGKRYSLQCKIHSHPIYTLTQNDHQLDEQQITQDPKKKKKKAMLFYREEENEEQSQNFAPRPTAASRNDARNRIVIRRNRRERMMRRIIYSGVSRPRSSRRRRNRSPVK